MSIQKAEQSQFEEIAHLAKEIWTDHYTPIIGIDQVNYMLDKFQSVEAMRDQVSNGYEYYVIIDEGKIVGYLSIKNEENALFLSKVYVHKSMRGRGFGRLALDFVESTAKERGLAQARLTVNKYNTNSIAAYEKLGWVKNQELVMDIGAGYVMDDFEMVKALN